jgi:hypothetical protein
MQQLTIVGFVALSALVGIGVGACSSGSSQHPSGTGGTGTGASTASSSGTGTGALGGSTSSASTGGQGGATTSSSPSTSSSSTGGPPPGCQANCTGKTCGDDGCDGTCGGCPPSQLCGPAQTCVASPSTTSIVVDAKSQGTVISPGIYGVALNSDDSMQVAALNRWGGDATGSYNWQTDAFNSGADWYCANYTGLFTAPSPDPSLKSSSDQFVHYNVAQKADTLMTIPLTGWVASMATPNATLQGLPDCPNAVAGVWDQNLSPKCCKDLGSTQSKLVDKGSSTLDTSYMSSWVQHLVSTFGSAAKGGVRYYQLDNEPDNWQYLRPDVYPSLYPPGTPCAAFYSTNAGIGKSLNQDFIDRTMAYAKAIKAADPTASVLFMSTENAQDLVALPNVECGNPQGPYTVDSSLTQAILKLAAMQESTSHQRVLDCVDMHYPFPGKGLGDTQALWNAASSSAFVPPHVQGWINGTYPGTGICVSEYNVNNDGTNGSTPDASTGAQEADILGMYGRLGYKVAAYWTTLVHDTTHLPVYNAMAMYRSYDGKGGQFGAYSIGAASPNAGVNVYASSDSPTSPTKVWVMLVNVSTAAQNNLSITLQNFTPTGSAQVFRSVGGMPPKADTAATITNGTITGFSLASNSVVLLVMSK